MRSKLSLFNVHSRPLVWLHGLILKDVDGAGTSDLVNNFGGMA